MKLSVDIEKKLTQFTMNIRMEIDQENVSILGPSGSGKSMALKCIAGIEKPDRGRIVLNDRVLFDSERGINLPPERRRVGYLFQNYALFPHMTVSENIEIALQNAWNRKKRVRELIEKFHLLGLEEAYPVRLSGGEQQRVALARMLAAEPELILLDEPFSALDGILREQMQQKLPGLLHGNNYLMVTHDMDEAYRLSDNILVMENGKMLAFDARERLFDHPPNLAAARILGLRNVSEAIRVQENMILVPQWGCFLECGGKQKVSHVGIRSQHVRISTSPGVNSFMCEIVRILEDRFTATLFFRLLIKRTRDVLLQAIVDKERWEYMKKGGHSLFACFPPDKLLLF
ncbi:MAG TPA: ATP-binding cassette domain-containing protein [Thermoclostridium caenicola]|nr:ATP-binding cassette domain-containing protein [Thermoclostridium caenicola]